MIGYGYHTRRDVLVRWGKMAKKGLFVFLWAEVWLDALVYSNSIESPEGKNVWYKAGLISPVGSLVSNGTVQRAQPIDRIATRNGKDNFGKRSSFPAAYQTHVTVLSIGRASSIKHLSRCLHYY